MNKILELLMGKGPDLINKLGPDLLPKIVEMIKQLLAQGKTESSIISEVAKHFNISEDLVKSIMKKKIK